MNLKLLEDTKLENCAPRNNNPAERSSHLLGGGSLKSRHWTWCNKNTLQP